MVQIPKSSFDKLHPVIINDVNNSDFISFDLELTGLNSKEWTRIANNDTIRSRYLRVRDAARTMQMIQLGITTFRWDTESNIWHARPYSFYILPKDAKFVCCESALRFLSKNTFSFSDWVKDGLSISPRMSESDKNYQNFCTVLSELNRPNLPEPLEKKWAIEAALSYLTITRAFATAVHQWDSADPDADGELLGSFLMKKLANDMENVRAGVYGNCSQSCVDSDVANKLGSEQHHVLAQSCTKFDSSDESSILRGCPYIDIRGCNSFRRRILKDIIGCGSTSKYYVSQPALKENDNDQHSTTENVANNNEYQCNCNWDDCVVVSIPENEQNRPGDKYGARIVWLVPALESLELKYGQDGEISSGSSNNSRANYLQALWRAHIRSEHLKNASDTSSLTPGLRTILDAMTNASFTRGVPIVGYNCLTDLLHLSNAVIRSPPPSCAQRWIDDLVCMFPVLFDVKVFNAGNLLVKSLSALQSELRRRKEANYDPSQDFPVASLPFLSEDSFWPSHKATYLEAAYQSVSSDQPLSLPLNNVSNEGHSPVPTNDTDILTSGKSVEAGSSQAAASWASLVNITLDNIDVTTEHDETQHIEISKEDGIEETKSNEVPHDAGFDAWMTGVVFARYMAAMGLSGDQIRSVGKLVLGEEIEKSQRTLAVQLAASNANCLFMMRASKDISVWRLSGSSDTIAARQYQVPTFFLPPMLRNDAQYVQDRLPKPFELADEIGTLGERTNFRRRSTLRIGKLNRSISHGDIFGICFAALRDWSPYTQSDDLHQALNATGSSQEDFLQLAQRLKTGDGQEDDDLLRDITFGPRWRDAITPLERGAYFITFASPIVASVVLGAWALQRRLAAHFASVHDSGALSDLIPEVLVNQVEQNAARCRLSMSEVRLFSGDILSIWPVLLDEWRGHSLPLLGGFTLETYSAFIHSYPEVFPAGGDVGCSCRKWRETIDWEEHVSQLLLTLPRYSVMQSPSSGAKNALEIDSADLIRIPQCQNSRPKYATTKSNNSLKRARESTSSSIPCLRKRKRAIDASKNATDSSKDMNSVTSNCTVM